MALAAATAAADVTTMTIVARAALLHAAAIVAIRATADGSAIRPVTPRRRDAGGKIVAETRRPSTLREGQDEKSQRSAALSGTPSSVTRGFTPTSAASDGPISTVRTNSVYLPGFMPKPEKINGTCES